MNKPFETTPLRETLTITGAIVTGALLFAALQTLGEANLPLTAVGEISGEAVQVAQAPSIPQFEAAEAPAALARPWKAEEIEPTARWISRERPAEFEDALSLGSYYKSEADAVRGPVERGWKAAEIGASERASDPRAIEAEDALSLGSFFKASAVAAEVSSSAVERGWKADEIAPSIAEAPGAVAVETDDALSLGSFFDAAREGTPAHSPQTMDSKLESMLAGEERQTGSSGTESCHPVEAFGPEPC